MAFPSASTSAIWIWMEAWSLAVMSRSASQRSFQEEMWKLTGGGAVSGDVEVYEGAFVVLCDGQLMSFSSDCLSDAPIVEGKTRMKAVKQGSLHAVT